MTLGKGFLGELLGCTLSFLLVVGLHVTGRDSPPNTYRNKLVCYTFFVEGRGWEPGRIGDERGIGGGRRGREVGLGGGGSEPLTVHVLA